MRFLKGKLPAIAILVLSGGIAAPVFAQPYPGIPEEHNEALGGFGAFHEFLASHPQLRADLLAHPNAINRPEFARNHPELQEFYENHPEVRGELERNAPDFMAREREQFAYQRGFTNFHDYLKTHHEVEDQIERNPATADDPAFLNAHPGLREYLSAHPQVAWQMKHDPNRFFRSEDQSTDAARPEPGAPAMNHGNGGAINSERDEHREPRQLRLEERHEKDKH